MEAVDRIAPLGTVPDEAVEANARIGALGPVSSPRLVASDLAFHASLVATEHAEILARIRRREVAGAVAAVRRHLMRTESALAQHLASSAHPCATSHSSDDLPATDGSPL